MNTGKVYIGLELSSDEIAILAPFLEPATKEEIDFLSALES